MSILFLDASAILAAFDPDDAHHEAAKRILAEPGISLATLDLARYEIANVAVRAWRAPDQVGSLLDAVDRIADDGGVVISDTKLLAKAAELAQGHGISVYDAAYVAATSKGNLKLVSCDARDLLSKGLALSPADALVSSEDEPESPPTV
ncbi:MAG: type II toxin-antitoxin system VapC family toxin [Solirubrobacteraceae bacterium]